MLLRRTRPRISTLPCSVWIMCVLLFQTSSYWSRHGAVLAAHSRRRSTVPRRGAPRYDRSIATFSSDGRMKQLEYGMEASQRGQTVAGFATDDTVCLAIAVDDDDNHHHHDSSQTNKVHRIDGHVYLITTGLQGDGRALASALRTECQQFRLSYGEAPNVYEVARLASEMQHGLTRIGGARPLACTACLIGVDPNHHPSSEKEDGDAKEDDDSNDNGAYCQQPQQLKLFQTEPGGSMEQCRYCAAGTQRKKAMEGLRKLEEKWMKASTSALPSSTLLSVGELAHGVATSFLQQATNSNDNDNDDDSDGGVNKVDIWIMQADKNRRGGTNMKCIKSVGRNNVGTLLDNLF